MTSFQNTFRNLLPGCFVSISLAVGAAPIVVGQVAPLSGVDAAQARAYSAGLQLALSKANKAGVGGHTFSLVRKDDHGQPGETVASTKSLLGESRPLVLAGYFGDRNVDVVRARPRAERCPTVSAIEQQHRAGRGSAR